MPEVGDLRVVRIVIIYSDGLPSVSREGSVRTFWVSGSGVGAGIVHRWTVKIKVNLVKDDQCGIRVYVHFDTKIT